jgi:hypothetical protein
MSQNGLFCIFIISPDLGLNPFIYGGWRDFRHIPAHFTSDPFGAMPDLTTLPVYK